jgi:AAA domain
MVTVVANQKGGVGKTTTAANIGALVARRGRRVLVVDTDPQFALTRQLGLEARSLCVNLVDVLAGRASVTDAIVRGVHGVNVVPGAGGLAGVEMSLVAELGRERFLHDALEPRPGDCRSSVNERAATYSVVDDVGEPERRWASNSASSVSLSSRGAQGLRPIRSMSVSRDTPSLKTASASRSASIGSGSWHSTSSIRSWG